MGMRQAALRCYTVELRFLAALHNDPRHSQHRHHRPRRPRQDDPRRPAAAPVWHLRRPPAGGRARHGLQRPGKGARHHHPGEELRHRVRGHAHQHRRHPGPCRFRRRGRARTDDGRQRAAAGRRRRGTHAADALRHAQGVGAGPETHCRHQQDRPPRRTTGLGHQPHLRPLRQARRKRRTARFPGGLRLGAERLRHARCRPARYRHAPALRGHPQACAATRGRRRWTAAIAHLLARLLQFRRPHRHRPHHARQDRHAAERAGHEGSGGRLAAQGTRQPGAGFQGARTRPHRRRRGRRHRADQRHY